MVRHGTFLFPIAQDIAPTASATDEWSVKKLKVEIVMLKKKKKGPTKFFLSLPALLLMVGSQALFITLLLLRSVSENPKNCEVVAVTAKSPDDNLWLSLLLTSKDQTVPNVLPRRRRVQEEDITMATHVSVDKLPRLLKQIQFWTGPVSAAVYISSDDEIKQFRDFINQNEGALSNTACHVLLEKEKPGDEPRFYPYNVLRNLAMSELDSNYFLAMDVDFLTPLKGGYDKLRLLTETAEVKAKLHAKTLLVLPAFQETPDSDGGGLPQSKEEVVRGVQFERTLIPFKLDMFPQGHSPTDYLRWYQQCTSPFYDIEYGFKFEPYVIGYREGLPQYWPGFRYSNNFDKYSWFLEAHYMGFKFAVLCDHFVVHKNHEYSYQSRGRNIEESKYQWRKFKRYLMQTYGASQEELYDSVKFLPPGHVPFNLSKTTLESDLLGAFKESYSASEYGEGPNRARRSDSGKFCFVDNPYCQAVGEIPEVLDAVREVLRIRESTPLFLWGVKYLKGWAGREHSLHSDLEFAVPECGRFSGATAYILLERECDDRSMMRLFSGSHELDFIADEELARVGCWSEGRKSLPCDAEALMEDVRQRYVNDIPDLRVVDGPSRVNEGVAWPTTAWHMTKNTCNRRALILQYTTSLTCARKLRFKTRGPVLGEQSVYPELYPFTPVGSHESWNTDDLVDPGTEAIDNLRLPGSTLEALPSLQAPGSRSGPDEIDGCSTVVENDKLSFFRRKVEKGALSIRDDVYVSGEFAPNPFYSPPTGTSLVPKHPWIKSRTLAVHAARTLYIAEKSGLMLHPPHVEITDEICVNLQGRVNAVLSSKHNCSQTFDTISVDEGQAVFIPSGITHTVSPDGGIDGEYLCFKFFPYQSRTVAGSGDKVAPTSRVANKACSPTRGNWPAAGQEVDLFYFRHGSAVKFRGEGKGFEILAKSTPTPGYNRLKAKVHHFAAGEIYDIHTDSYDLIAVSIKGSIEVSQGGGNTSMFVPEHQYAFVPANVMHGFSASKGEAEVLFIEIETMDKAE